MTEITGQLGLFEVGPSPARQPDPLPAPRPALPGEGLQTRPGLRDDGRVLTIQERFDEWMETDDGRKVYAHIRDRALDLRRRGWEHFAVGCLWETARYDSHLRAGPTGGYKLNDHFRSRIARVLMTQEPELDGFFEIRELKA